MQLTMDKSQQADCFLLINQAKLLNYPSHSNNGTNGYKHQLNLNETKKQDDALWKQNHVLEGSWLSKRSNMSKNRWWMTKNGNDGDNGYHKKDNDGLKGGVGGARNSKGSCNTVEISIYWHMSAHH